MRFTSVPGPWAAAHLVLSLTVFYVACLLCTADEKTPPNTNTRRTAELAFKALDTDGSGGVNLDEFIKALERFGMHVCAHGPPCSRRELTRQVMHEANRSPQAVFAQVAGMRQGLGGLPRDTVQALFNKYDADGSGASR